MSKQVYKIIGCSALLFLGACAYDPYYKPLAAHNYYADEPHFDAYPGPGPGRYHEREWHGYDRRWDDDDRYRYYHR